jgi:hypothetical protein
MLVQQKLMGKMYKITVTKTKCTVALLNTIKTSFIKAEDVKTGTDQTTSYIDYKSIVKLL